MRAGDSKAFLARTSAGRDTGAPNLKPGAVNSSGEKRGLAAGLATAKAPVVTAAVVTAVVVTAAVVPAVVVTVAGVTAILTGILTELLCVGIKN